MEKGYIKYIVIIVIILIVVFLSQQTYFREMGKNLASKASAPIQAYLAKGSTVVKDGVLSKINGEVANGGALIQNQINQEKQKVSDSIATKIGNYFSGIENSVVHPGTPQNCQPTQTSSASQPNP